MAKRRIGLRALPLESSRPRKLTLVPVLRPGNVARTYLGPSGVASKPLTCSCDAVSEGARFLRGGARAGWIGGGSVSSPRCARIATMTARSVISATSRRWVRHCLQRNTHIQAKNAPHQLGPQVPVRRSRGDSGFLFRGRSIFVAGTGPSDLGHQLVTPRSTRREHAVVGLQLHTRRGHEGRETLEEHEELAHHVRRAVAPVSPGAEQRHRDDPVGRPEGDPRQRCSRRSRSCPGMWTAACKEQDSNSAHKGSGVNRALLALRVPSRPSRAPAPGAGNARSASCRSWRAASGVPGFLEN